VEAVLSEVAVGAEQVLNHLLKTFDTSSDFEQVDVLAKEAGGQIDHGGPRDVAVLGEDDVGVNGASNLQVVGEVGHFKISGEFSGIGIPLVLDELASDKLFGDDLGGFLALGFLEVSQVGPDV